MLYAISLAHPQSTVGETESNASIPVSMDISSVVGHDLLCIRWRQLQPRRLGHVSKDWFQAYFLLILGTILSVGVHHQAVRIAKLSHGRN